MRRRGPVAAETDDEIPLWVRQSPGGLSDPMIFELAAMPGAPTIEDAAALPAGEREPWGTEWAWLFALEPFRRTAARAWCAARGLVLDAAECGVAIKGPLDASWAANRGLYNLRDDLTPTS